MIKEKREAARNAGHLSVMLTLRDHRSGELLTEGILGRLSNVSVAGASLALDHIRSDGYHLFYATKDNPTMRLYLESDDLYAGGETFSIPVKPVWFNCEGLETSQLFRLGVEFTDNPNGEMVRLLIRKACDQPLSGGGWWGKNICALVNGIRGIFVRRW